MICTTTQDYYGNANGLYASLKPPMLGHGARDVNCGYGTDIECPLDGFVYSVFDDKHPAKDGYWAIYMICEYKGQLGELCIGHVSKIMVNIGDYVKKGQVIAQEGNHGIVYDNGILITLAQQAKGDIRGHHRHWQWRPLKLSKAPIGQCLTDFTGRLYTKDGMYYTIPDYYNGFHGLSPLIDNILDDYDKSKMDSAINNNPVVLQNSLLKQALDALGQVLKGLLIKYK